MLSKKREDSYKRFQRLSDKIRYGTLLGDFNDWTLCGPDGWTLAHQAAAFRSLPYDFDNLELADNDGYTVAHVLAAMGGLPINFNKWDLRNNEGWTVAHERANQNSYISTWGVKEWGLKDNNGLTVLDVYKISIDELYERYGGNLYICDPDHLYKPLLEFKELLTIS